MSLNPRTNASVFWTAVTAALIATVNVLALLFDWNPDVVAAINIMIGAWVGVLALVINIKTVDVHQLELYAEAVSHE